ncbi:unnamed protein product [Xylocopa violacea]|uniref:IQ motif and ubiquitin-like domain-containing protein n=1 Tax=Xylocopa violacea TaxID=135666 RepID=A0ABP1NYT0_XYLVO
MENPTTTARPFLGGWRSKVTGTVYYNASTQTGRNADRKEKRVQTRFTADKFTNMERDAGVQTGFHRGARDRLDGSTLEDSSLKDPSNEKILESVVKIQRFYRAHRDRLTASRLVSVSAGVKNTEPGQTHPEPGCYRSRDFVILNRTSPRTTGDFELLYNLLDRWRCRETEMAAERLFDSSRLALGSLILSKEVELLRAIDAMKTRVKLRKKERSYEKFLDELSRPVVWRNARGEPISVDTLRVQRARGFKHAFDELSKEYDSVEERLEALNRTRRDVETHTCKASDEVIRLLDQEVDLLNRNVDESKLNWLRSRLKMAFLRLAREALGNEREDLSRIQSSCKVVCRSCGRLLPVEKFPRENQRRSFSCNYCLRVKVRTEPRAMLEPYRRLLRSVRRHEARMHCHTSLAFAIDEGVVYRLVNDIWHGKSAISENDCLDELRLVRFRNDEEWTPWNSVLLTASEASLHSRVKDLDKFYGAMILQKFYTKNLLAKVRLGSVAEFKSVYG